MVLPCDRQTAWERVMGQMAELIEKARAERA